MSTAKKTKRRLRRVYRRWEYLDVIAASGVERDIHGVWGWELVAVSVSNQANFPAQRIYHFKRPLI